MPVEPFNQFVFFGLFNLMRVQKNVNKHPTGPVFAALALDFPHKALAPAFKNSG
jgi:hypothetical protein